MNEPSGDAEVGRRLKDAREEVGLSQAAAARELGVDVATISRWERGARPIKHRDEMALLRLYERARAESSPLPGAAAREMLLRNAVRRLRALVEELEDLVSSDPKGIPAALSAIEPQELEEEEAPAQRRRRSPPKGA